VTAHSLLQVLHHGPSICSSNARKGCHLQRELRKADGRFHPIVVVKEPQVTYGPSSQIMSYILNMLICVGMILLANLLQYFLFIAMINLSKICNSTVVLVMLMIYSWIKIKLKMLIFSPKRTFDQFIMSYF
jgi:hypothetical protein